MRLSKQLRCLSYDVNINAFPEAIEFTYDLPQLYMFPAYNKRPPHIKYNGKGHAGAMLLYIQKMADIEIKYPTDVSKIGLPRENKPEPETSDY